MLWEWFTDAIVLPETGITTAVDAAADAHSVVALGQIDCAEV